MATINISSTQFVANQEKDSLPITLIGKTHQAQIALVDSNSQWDSTAGNVKQWGLQCSEDGGVSWRWGPVYQGDVNDPSKWLAFGSRSRSGGMPSLTIESALVGNIIGVSNTVNPTITTDTLHNLSAGQRISIDSVLGASLANGVWLVLEVPSPTTFTIALAAPGLYVSGGRVWAGGLVNDVGDQIRLAMVTDANIRLGAQIVTNS